MNRKHVLLGVVCALVPFMVRADAPLEDVVKSIRLGLDNKYQIQTLRVDGNATIGGKITGVAGGTGTAISTNGSTVVDTDYGVVRQTELTIANAPMIIVNLVSSNSTAGLKVYDFPEGRIDVLGVVVSKLTMTTNTWLTSTCQVTYAFGTIKGTDDALTGTEANLCPTGATTQITNNWSTALATAAQFDGTSTPVDMYLNVCVDSNYLTHGITNYANGKAVITWVNLGDY